MEDSEKNIIRNNLPNLVENTICGAVFLAGLLASGILSQSDLDTITSKSEKSKQSSKLYDIIQTRKNGFEVLKSWLKKTNQSGALHLLTPNSNRSTQIYYDHNSPIYSGNRPTKYFRGRHAFRDVAVKPIFFDPAKSQQLINEIEILKHLPLHTNIVQYYSIDKGPDWCYIAYELCTTSLLECVDTQTFPTHPTNILKESIKGLLYLHQHNILHGKLTPSKILLIETSNTYSVVKIAGFRHARKLQTNRELESSKACVKKCTAPEVMTSLEPESIEQALLADVYSLGCICVYTFTGVYPEDDNCWRESLKNSNADSRCISLIEAMLFIQPSQRPSCVKILSHPFFSSFASNGVVEIDSHLSFESFKKPKDLELSHHSKQTQNSMNEASVRPLPEQNSNMMQTVDQSCSGDALAYSKQMYTITPVSLKPEVSVAVGIDMGTSYCSVFVFTQFNHQKNMFLQNRVPSYFSLRQDGSVLVGEDAKKRAYQNPKYTYFDFKRMIGKRMEDPDLVLAIHTWPFSIKKSPDNLIYIVGDTANYDPRKIFELFLKYILEMAQKYLGGKISQAVIAVPTNFGPIQRAAVKHAAISAGLQTSRLLDEPIAAAITYTIKRIDHAPKLILIFDVGGGTFDVAIVDLTSKEIKTKGRGGSYLGGNDFDYCLLKFCIQEYNSANSAILNEVNLKFENPRVYSLLLDECEQQKKILDVMFEVDIFVPNVTSGIDLNVCVTREKYESLIGYLVEKMICQTSTVLTETNLSATQIEEIVLVGGSTRTPLVQRRLSQLFYGKPLYTQINPDEAVVFGAAVHAAHVYG